MGVKQKYTEEEFEIDEYFIEQMQQFTKGFETFADSHQDMVAQAYLGKKVNISEDGSDVSGLVDSVEKNDDGEVFVTVGDKNYLPENGYDGPAWEIKDALDAIEVFVDKFFNEQI